MHKGIELDKRKYEEFLSLVNMETKYASEIVEMGKDPWSYYDKHDELYEKYDIFPSEFMYQLYFLAILEEQNIIKTIDWKEEVEDVVWKLENLMAMDLQNIKEKISTDDTYEVLFFLSGHIESETDKVMFFIDTQSDSYSFGIIEKKMYNELVDKGKNIAIKIYCI